MLLLFYVFLLLLLLILLIVSNIFIPTATVYTVCYTQHLDDFMSESSTSTFFGLTVLLIRGIFAINLQYCTVVYSDMSQYYEAPTLIELTLNTALYVLIFHVCMYGHTYSKSMDQPGKVANPARDQLNRKKWKFPCPRSCLRIWSRETGSAVPSFHNTV